MKKFGISWSEEVQMNCYVVIEAKSKEDALKKFHDGEFDDYDRDESSNSFDKGSEECKEIKE